LHSTNKKRVIFFGEEVTILPRKLGDLIRDWMRNVLKVEKAGHKLQTFFNDHRYHRRNALMVSLFA